MSWFSKIPSLPEVARPEAAPPPDFMPDEAFLALVDLELERIGKHHAGVLAVEALTLVQHFDVEPQPSPFDFAELRAVTLLLANKYGVEALQRFCAAKTHESLWELTRRQFSDAPEGYQSWRALLLEHAPRVELDELEREPLHFLIEWRDEDPRLEAEKLRILSKASYKTLTALLLLLAEREMQLIEFDAPVHPEPERHDYKLWQGISLTRQMREAVTTLWCAHPKTPKDYREKLAGKSALEQWQFLEPRRDRLNR